MPVNYPQRSGLPVMVWIHVGAYVIGSNNTPEYDGTALAAINDVIVVSINYRLAAFGFLYAGSLSSYSNHWINPTVYV